MTSSARRRGLFAALTAALLAGFFSVSSPAPANAGITSTERAVISWINADREARGLRALRPWTTLYDIAEMRAKRMAAANVMSHTISGNLGSQLTGYGVRYYSKGENIAYTSRYTGRDAARHIYRMWKASSIHWAQMMSQQVQLRRGRPVLPVEQQPDVRVPRLHRVARPHQAEGLDHRGVEERPRHHAGHGAARTFRSRRTPPASATSTSSTGSTADRGISSGTTSPRRR